MDGPARRAPVDWSDQYGGVPTTVTTALEDRPVAGRTCLEAGAGVGNTTAGLLAAGATRVYALTDDSDHARLVRERCAGATERLAVVTADLELTPLVDDSVGLVTAHGLCNLLTPAEMDAVASELTRVAAPGAHLVVDEYAPLPADAPVRDLFALENAATELAVGRPALTFYPAEHLRRLFEGFGWRFERKRTLLEPVPWTEAHVRAHAAAVEHAAEMVPPALGEPLADRASALVSEIGADAAGEMYSLAFRLPDGETEDRRQAANVRYQPDRRPRI